MRTPREDIERLSVRLEEIDAEIEKISAKIDSGNSATRAKNAEMQRELIRLRDTAASRLHELSARETDDALASRIGGEAQDAWSDLERALQSASDRVFASS